MANETSSHVPVDEETVTLSNVVITGSRPAVKSSLETPAPVDVITQSESLTLAFDACNQYYANNTNPDVRIP